MDTVYNDDYLICSGSYSEIMNRDVLPALDLQAHNCTISAFDGRPLWCASYHAEAPAGTVVLVHGFTENAYKYAELIWSLTHLHFSVVAYDQRGHGRSWRADGLQDASVTHVDRFSDYVQDLHTVCDTLLKDMPKPWFVFGHSMGGAVVTLFLEQYPDVFSAAVLSSPMIAPNIGGIPVKLASALAQGARLLGRGKKHPFFMKPYAGPEDFATSCATDPERFAWYDGIKASRRDFQNSVPSYIWSYESIHVTEKILAQGMPEKIVCPVLLFSAETDSSVLPGPQAELISRIPNGQSELVRNARHEIFRSTNDVLFPWWHRVITFFTGISETQAEGGLKP